MSFALVIGNIARGFRVISGFKSEDEAHSFVAENREHVGQEVRVAGHVHVDDALVTQDAAKQDTLKFETAKSGEAIDPATGASIDVQEHNDANVGSDGSSGEGAADSGSGSSGDSAPISGLRGTSEPSSGDLTDAASDGGNAGSGNGASGKGDLSNE